ncbi:hypothetical protein ONE63_001075 [Megalurothrips usitatus]|uniref:Retrotransposon gag domain-containing protein n=1 Tax=Megalurothrips usitatus TaxID=439358 RepID=A0AAV7XAZ8_9NEOP|nr:hypothetical protein ONE63_001075 [Megalurothrips usitatus]
MDSFLGSLTRGTPREQLAKYTSIRNFISARKEPAAPKVAVKNLGSQRGLITTVQVLTDVVELVQDTIRKAATSKRASPRVQGLAQITERCAGQSPDHLQVELQPTNAKDDDRRADRIVVDVLKLQEYLSQVSDRHQIELNTVVTPAAASRVEQPQVINPLPWLVDRTDQAIALGQELLQELTATAEPSEKVRVYNIHTATAWDCTQLADEFERCLRAVRQGCSLHDVEFQYQFRDLSGRPHLRLANAAEYRPGDNFIVVDIRKFLSYLEDLPENNPGVRQPSFADLVVTCVQLLVIRFKTFYDDFAARDDRNGGEAERTQKQQDLQEIVRQHAETFRATSSSFEQVLRNPASRDRLQPSPPRSESSDDPLYERLQNFLRPDPPAMSRRGGFLGSPPHSPSPPPSERDSTEDERAQPHFRAGFHMSSLDGFGTPPFMRHTQAPPAGPHAPRLQLPTLRDGGDVRDFLLKFERRVDFYRCTDREKILHLEDCIQHRAISAWLTQFLKNRGNASYQTVENALTAAFCPPEDDRHLREAMVARRKQDGETVNTYFMDKVVLINKFSPDMKANEQISYIREGLPPNLQVKLAGQKFDGITHLRDYLVTLEADIQELQRTKILSADLFATPSPVKTVTVQEPPAAPVAAEGIAALQLEAKLDSLIAAIGSMWSHEKHSSDDRRKRDDTPYRQRSRGSSWERRGSYSRSRDRSQDRSRDRSRDRSWGRDSRRDSRDRDSRRDSRDRDYRRDSRGRDHRRDSRDRDYRRDSRGRDHRRDSRGRLS